MEVMTCRNGCVGGAGQPYGTGAQKQCRAAGLYQSDQSAELRYAEQNPLAAALLERMGREQIHALLHVSRSSREAERETDE